MADSNRNVPLPEARHRPGLVDRFLSRRAATLLARNTVVSCGIFAFNLALLSLLVEVFAMDELPAAAVAFIAGNSIQYVFGRTWVFRGTERAVASGYVYYFVNAGIGLVVTLTLFWAMLEFTSIHYLVSRTIVSVFAGLTVFLLNATLNFRQL